MSRPKRKCLLRLGSLLTAATLLTACTDGGSGVQTQTVDPPSTSNIATTTSTPATSASVEPSLLPSSQTVESATVSAIEQWPSTFTPTQIESAQASLVAVTGLTSVTEQASAAPSSRDWTSEVYRYAGGAAALQTLASIQSLVTANVHATAPRTYENLVVLSADDHRVVVEACVDSTKLTLVDASGQSVLTPPANLRVIETYTLYVPETGGWLVGEMAVSDPVRVC